MRRNLQKRTPIDRVELGQRVKAARIDKGLTQAQLAETLGWSSGQIISDFERGRRQSQDRTLTLAAALGVDVRP